MEIILILSLAGIGWFWWDSLGARETAYQTALRACQLRESIILDNTVVLKKLWLRRNEKGHMELCRFYYFTFTTDGESSYQAYVVMLGKRVAEFSLDANQINLEKYSKHRQ